VERSLSEVLFPEVSTLNNLLIHIAQLTVLFVEAVKFVFEVNVNYLHCFALMFFSFKEEAFMITLQSTQNFKQIPGDSGLG
jgi:hypothetical protein